jgi:hypothetical protein
MFCGNILSNFYQLVIGPWQHVILLVLFIWYILRRTLRTIMNAIMVAEYYSFIQQYDRQVIVHGGEPAIHPDTLLLLEDRPSWSMLLRMIWYGLASEAKNLRNYERFGNMIRKWGVSNYFFWKGIRVVAPETCLESRCLKRK